jgi:hypothetical protein
MKTNKDAIMGTCRSWLKAVYSTADNKVRRRFVGAAVLGDKYSGYTIELHDGTQIHMGRTHCAYCARAEALCKLEPDT